MELQGSKTEQNLAAAFAGESMAKNTYEYYAKVAKKEGYEQIAEIFLKTASQEQSHAKQFFKLLEGNNVTFTNQGSIGKMGTTTDNLNTAIENETDEAEHVYIKYAEEARSEGFHQAASIFQMIADIEKVHADRFTKLLNKLKDDSTFKREDRTAWECRKCGHIHHGKEAPGICPACMHPKGYFEEQQQNY